MKSIKLICILALTVPIAMAFVSASPAMAEFTELCSTDSEDCNAITHVHAVSVGKVKLLSSLLTAECSTLFLGDATVGSPLTVEGNFTFAECASPTLGTCEAKEVSSEALIEVLKEGHETAKVTGQGEILVECGAFFHCVFNGTGLIGVAKGPLLSVEENGEISLQEQTVNKVSGFLCPSVAKLDLKMTPLEPTFIGKGNLKMVCIDVGTGNGYYLQVDNNDRTKCLGASNDFPNRLGHYELAYAITNEANKMVCAEVGAQKGFFLKSEANGLACVENSEDASRLGRYELGTTQ